MIMQRCVVFYVVIAIQIIASTSLQVIQSSDYVTQRENINEFPQYGGYSAAAGKHIFTFSHAPSATNQQAVVYTRVEDGSYVRYEAEWPRVIGSLTTNGNWFGTLGSGFITPFQANETGGFVNKTEFISDATYLQFLSDNSLILMSDTWLETREWNGSTWNLIQTMPVNITAVTIFPAVPGNSDSQPHLTDNTLAGFNPVDQSIDLYTRNADKSWSKIDSFPIDITQIRANRIIWNGDDSVILVHASYYDWDLYSYGRVIVYVKNNGTWSIQSILAYVDYSIGGGTTFGYAVLMLDPTSVVIAAPSDESGGVVFLLQRNSSGTWQFTTMIESGPGGEKNFGVNVMKNDYELVIQSHNAAWLDVQTAFVTVDWCALPLSVDVTCHDVHLESCDTLQEIFLAELHTVGTMAICPYRAFVHKQKYSRTQLWVEIGFERESAQTVYCSASYFCPQEVVPVTAPVTCHPHTPDFTSTPAGQLTPVSSSPRSTSTPTSSTTSTGSTPVFNLAGIAVTAGLLLL